MSVNLPGTVVLITCPKERLSHAVWKHYTSGIGPQPFLRLGVQIVPQTPYSHAHRPFHRDSKPSILAANPPRRRFLFFLGVPTSIKARPLRAQIGISSFERDLRRRAVEVVRACSVPS
jgi:hypothetical protein